MNLEGRHSEEMYPPLLREQVFSDHGAADWVRTIGGRDPFPAWVLVAISLGLVIGFIVASITIQHRQVVWRPATLAPNSYQCGQAATNCSVTLLLTKEGLVSDPSLEVRQFVSIRDALGRQVEARLVSIQLVENDSNVQLVVSWPDGAVAPIGRPNVGIGQARSLASWVLTGGDEARKGSGE